VPNALRLDHHEFTRAEGVGMPPTTALRALPWSDRLGYGSAIRLARGIIGYDGGEPVLYIRTPLGIGRGLCIIIEGNFRELTF
jgi:hypothetical protein